MPHLYAKARNAGHKMAAQYKKRGGSVFDEGVANVENGKAGVLGGKAARANAKAEALKAEGKPSKDRLDKTARGGFMKPPKAKGFRNPKGPHIHIKQMNVMTAPQTGGAPTDGAEPMVPEEPMAPPTGKLGSGIPGMVKRGGKARIKRVTHD